MIGHCCYIQTYNCCKRLLVWNCTLTTEAALCCTLNFNVLVSAVGFLRKAIYILSLTRTFFTVAQDFGDYLKMFTKKHNFCAVLLKLSFSALYCFLF